MGEFVRAIALSDLKPGQVTALDVGGLSLALYIIDGWPHCTDNICTHEGMALSNGGFVEGDEVECSWHGARFSIRTGQVIMAPANTSIRSYPTEIRGDYVYVMLH